MSSTDSSKAPTEGPNRLATILQLLPKLPLAARVALLHILHVSPQSKYLDLRTEVAVAVLRSFLTPSKPMSITHSQKVLGRDPGIKGRIWVSKYTAPASPGIGVQDAMIRAIEGLQQDPPLSKDRLLKGFPEALPVEAEWTGYRADATPDSRLPPVSEEEKYGEMMKEVKSPITILYFHGGAYYLMDPSSHRPTCKKLAKLTGGRCYSVRYRLAPQNPFPAAVMDALASYLALLYPPPGAFHEAVRPEHIVFAGDSAGGNLSLALLQTILELNRQSETGTSIQWHGADVSLPLPAGVAVNSPWLDLTHSLSSCSANAPYDYLPSFGSDRHLSSLPPCAAWPATPPRKQFYAADDLITHPLVTLLMARNWEGAPPMYICTGWELLGDEDKYFAGKLARDGVRVTFEEYEAMPHCFALVFPWLQGSRRCFKGWSEFIKGVVDGNDKEKESSTFVTVKASSLDEVTIEPEKLSPFGDEEVWERVRMKMGATVGALDETPAKL